MPYYTGNWLKLSGNLWSDEPKFVMFCLKYCQYMQMRSGERYNNEYLQPNVEQWWRLWLQPVVLGILSRIYGITNAEKYHLIMINHSVPYKQPLIGNVLIFQHDNPIYTVNALKAYLNRKTWLNRLLSSFELFLTYILHFHVCFLGSNRCYSCLLFPICLAKYKKKNKLKTYAQFCTWKEKTHI